MVLSVVIVVGLVTLAVVFGLIRPAFHATQLSAYGDPLWTGTPSKPSHASNDRDDEEPSQMAAARRFG